MLNYLYRNVTLSIRDMTRNILRTLLSGIGIIFLIAFLVMYLSLRESVKHYVGGKLFGTMRINEIVVTPKVPRKGGIMNMLKKPVGISPGAVNRISKIHGVKSVFSIIRLDYATQVRLDIFGNYIREHIPLYGINRAFLSKFEKRWKNFLPGDTIPVIAPKFVLEIFNSMITGRGLPAFSESALQGFPMKLIITTTPRGARHRKQYDFQAKLYSFTSAIPLTGLVVPAPFIQRFSRVHRVDAPGKGTGYSNAMLYVKVKQVKDLPYITKQIQRMGMNVESQRDIASKTNRALAIIDSSSLIIIAVFLLLTVIAIFNSYLTIVYHRSLQFSLQRIIGFSKLRIILTFVIEAAVIGALFGVIGFFLGNFAISYLADNLARWVPVLKGLTLAAADSGLLPIAVGFSCLVSSISAFIPAVFASNINLFTAVQQ